MNINIKLDKNFTMQFNKLYNEFGTELAKLNGFADEQLSYTDFIDNFVDKQTVADASIDGNANVGTKDICSLESEMSKPHSKLLAFNKIYYELNKKYGFKTANSWLRNEWDGHFYLHDASSSSMKPYCFAYDLENLVNKGLYFVSNFNAQPPKHLVTFTDFVGEFVSYTSNRSSGACGLPSFLVYSFYFWKKDVDNGYYTDTPERYRDQEFQRIVYKLNQPYLRVNQSAFTNFSIYDRPYYEALFGGKEFPDGSFMIDYVDEFVEYQKAFMKVVGEIRNQNMMTFPVLTYCLLRKNGRFVDEDFAKWCCKQNMKWADSNFFISEDVTSLSNCCRLVSSVKNLGYFNSIGGTALEVGSIKVNTVNLARIAYESDTQDDYIALLKEKVDLCVKALDVVRHIISRNIEKGLLPNYTYDLIHLKSQYNTIGIIGIYETLQKFGYVKKDEMGYAYYTDEGIEFGKKIFEAIHEVKDKFAEDKDYSINIEQVPAERAASILMQKDKFFYPNEKYELPLYGNQWIPLGIKTSIHEKTRLSAIFDKACNGGSIAHVNIDAPFTDFDTAWRMLNYMADSGVPYFAFCTRISACENNHGFYGDVCPICGKPKVTTYQRIVGFLTPEKTYSKERKAEFAMRDWFDLSNGDFLMRVTNIVYEDFVNYKKPSMFLGSISCDFKCCVEGEFETTVCQNSSLAHAKITNISNYDIYNKYIHNPITKAIVIGGLEPILQWNEVLDLIYFFRTNGCDDDFVIYTGYTEDELEQTVLCNFKKFKNIIFKFGRFRMNEPHHYDEVLGVELASPNQYAKRIS